MIAFTDPVVIARQLDFIREAQNLGQNKGARVEGVQRWSLGSPGDSWCCEWATMVLDIAYKANSPIGRMGSCEDLHSLALEKHWIAETPSVGDLALSIDPTTKRAHHIAIVTATEPLTAIAGNTSADGTSSNGDGVYEHAISPINKVFVHYPR